MRIKVLEPAINSVTFAAIGYVWASPAGTWWEPNIIIRIIEGLIILLTAVINFLRLIYEIREL